MSKIIWTIIIVALCFVAIYLIPFAPFIISKIWGVYEEEDDYYKDNHKSFRTYDGKSINQ